jgi:thiosulfate dehydrogenase (quinone) large subunit
MVTWLRTNVYASGVLLLIRLYLGWEWLSAGWGKITDEKGFTALNTLKKAVETPVNTHGEIVYPTYTAFIKNIVLPNIDVINFVIPYGELLVGLGLILGCLTTTAMFFGILMNSMFMFAGTVSSNPWMVILGSLVLYAGFNAGRFGADYWVIPWIRQYSKKLFSKKTPHTPAA